MKNQNPIVAEQSFSTSAEIVWNAITHIEQMRQWYFENIPDFRPEVGFEVRFNVKSGERNFLHIWKVTEVIPLKKIAYSWNFEEYPGEALTTFELREKGPKTILTLKSYVIKNFPANIPEFKRESGQAGWDYFIKEKLPSYLENH
jgi:uncharacterized protein YndB with AHSA1/START domain